jgi:hypothetical protein
MVLCNKNEAQGVLFFLKLNIKNRGMQFTFKNGGEWYWLRNDKETETWKLCAKRMDILPREIIAEVAKYLYDATYYHQACNECMKDATWLPVVPKGRFFWEACEMRNSNVM